MQIPKEHLEEKNYEGTRLIEVTDAHVFRLKEEIRKFQPKAKPILEKMNKLSVKLDPYYTKIRELDAQKEKLKAEMKPTHDLFDAQLKKMEAIEQKTDIIKNKIQPIIARLIKGKLGEFETGRQLIEEGDKLFVEVIDEIEEKIKTIRASKAKAKVDEPKK